jgi:hypothetical protein
MDKVSIKEFEKFSESITMFTVVCAFPRFRGAHFFALLPPESNLDDIDMDLFRKGVVA